MYAEQVVAYFSGLYYFLESPSKTMITLSKFELGTSQL
jgi:hypothetical protein